MFWVILFLFTSLEAMEIVPTASEMVEQAIHIKPRAHTSIELANKLAQIIDLFGDDPEITDEQEQFRWLALQYLRHESQTAATNIGPHLRERLRDSNGTLTELLNQSDKRTLLRYVHNMISESIDDAFKQKAIDYERLQAETSASIRKTRIALIISLIGGVSGILAAFFGAYFGH